MQYGQLFLVGDAAHIVPPTGAKGLNLAGADVALLCKIFCRVYEEYDRTATQYYSPIALRRVWHCERFSWWMSNLLHEYGDERISQMLPEMFERFMTSELDYYLGSDEGRRVIAKQYVGLPYEDLP